MVLLPLWFDICLIQIGKLLNICKAIDEKGMLCVERMAIHLVEGMSGCVGVSKFNDGISVQAQLDKIRQRHGLDLPMALSSLVVPWQDNIIRLDRGTLPCKLLRNFCQESLKF